MKAERIRGLVITCPEWYRRADFQAVLEQYTRQVHGQRRLATWYWGEGAPEPGSEVFMTAEAAHGGASEFSECDILPADIEAALSALLAEYLPAGGLVMLRNDPEPFTADERLLIARQVYEALAPCDNQQVASDLADLMAAILHADHCAWPESRPIVQLLRERLPQEAAVWQFVATREDAVVHGLPHRPARRSRT